MLYSDGTDPEACLLIMASSKSDCYSVLRKSAQTRALSLVRINYIQMLSSSGYRPRTGDTLAIGCGLTNGTQTPVPPHTPARDQAPERGKRSAACRIAILAAAAPHWWAHGSGARSFPIGQY